MNQYNENTPNSKNRRDPVEILSDFSGGQFLMLDDVDYYSVDGWQQWLDVALDALNNHQERLDDWTRHVATRLASEIPALIAEAGAREKFTETPIAQTRNTEGFVYLLRSVTGAFKIGRTVNPDDRMRTFAVKLPFEVEFTCVIATENMYQLERELHARFSDQRINGEWFNLNDEDVDYIKGLV